MPAFRGSLSGNWSATGNLRLASSRFCAASPASFVIGGNEAVAVDQRPLVQSKLLRLL